MKRIILAGLALAFISFAFTTSAQEPGIPMGPDPPPIVSDDVAGQTGPASPNTNLRSMPRKETVGESLTGWFILLVFAGMITGIVMVVKHSIRRVDQGRGGIHRPNLPYQGGTKKVS